MPLDHSQLLMTMLDALGVVTRTVEHPPLRTIDDSKRLRGDLPGGHAKSLFLKDKKGGYWLLVALEQTRVDLRVAASQLQAPRFSFANENDLGRLLGVVPGAVSPFAAVNDEQGHVCVVLEQRVLACDILNCHPLRNDRTTTIAIGDLLKFLEHVRHSPRVIDLPEPTASE
ncbi:prolyl-tRNA synthetase associated domain-containing protein [Accumulibacter sp.]|uniref:prolyl-tRNA synthetase associated domain-containing protein n=1 Tax=Accumulibacter sp. TaxID=2053492 RepID=UPI0028C37DC8|nr:prolyl-tRNA synthetase associated domain-containing protein [Accumulibacter sp.]